MRKPTETPTVNFTTPTLRWRYANAPARWVVSAPSLRDPSLMITYSEHLKPSAALRSARRLARQTGRNYYVHKLEKGADLARWWFFVLSPRDRYDSRTLNDPPEGRWEDSRTFATVEVDEVVAVN